MTKLYYEASDFALFEGDCNDIMAEMEECSVDLIFADPPYFLSNGGTTCKSGKRASVNKGKWDKSSGVNIDHEFNIKWIESCHRVMKDNATIWISGTHHNIYSVGLALQELGFKILNHITWEKKSPPPNLSCRYFTHATESIIWAAKSAKSKYCFNYADMKKENGGKQMKSVWTMGVPLKKEKRFGKYPAQKPEILLERIILSSSVEGNVVLDPFNGSGTSGIVATRLKRNYIGIDNNSEGLDISIKRYESK